MDIQLEWITSIFNRSEVKYWIDSGTLLGIIRGKKLIDNDNDLDLSIWHTDINKVIKLMSEIKSQGYRVRMLYYKGNIVKIKCLPKNKQNRIIDISVYNRSLQGYIWSPQVIEKNFNSVFLKAIKRVLMFFWLSVVKKVSIDRLPWICITNIHTWWIPIHYLEEVVNLEETKICVPRKYLDYLNFRYGDWKTPNPDWNFVTDDKGLINLAPDVLI